MRIHFSGKWSGPPWIIMAILTQASYIWFPGIELDSKGLGTGVREKQNRLTQWCQPDLPLLHTYSQSDLFVASHSSPAIGSFGLGQPQLSYADDSYHVLKRAFKVQHRGACATTKILGGMKRSEYVGIVDSPSPRIWKSVVAMCCFLSWAWAFWSRWVHAPEIWPFLCPFRGPVSAKWQEWRTCGRFGMTPATWLRRLLFNWAMGFRCHPPQVISLTCKPGSNWRDRWWHSIRKCLRRSLLHLRLCGTELVQHWQ